MSRDDDVAAQPQQQPAAHQRRPRPRRRRALFVLTLIIILLGVLELGLRVGMAVVAGTSVWAPDLTRMHYPELRAVQREHPSRGGETFDVLLIGGSVMHADWGWVEPMTQAALKDLVSQPVVVHNLAMPAHTSRDTRMKYALLDGPRFDLVVVCHGINDVRAGAAPPGIYRDDYRHMRWYRSQHVASRHAESRWLITPGALHLGWDGLLVALAGDRLLGRGAPPEAWRHHAQGAPTASAFTDNLRAVIEMAKSRGDRIVLATFAIFWPNDLNERFDPGSEGGLMATGELWGRPDLVAVGVAAHNDVTRRLAATHDLPLADIDSVMPRDGDHFFDICHLTQVGSVVFAAELRRAVEPLLQR